VTVELKPETQQLVREEIQRGRFHSVDELIVQGVHAWREKRKAEQQQTKSRKKLYNLLSQPPFAGSGLTIERQKDDLRPVDLD
jgi:Arc/MetJ-type ribon-helix-helix transcriptional regulator